MKAIVYTKYGSPDVIQLKEIEKPAPKDDEVLVKVLAASANAYDWHFLSADIFLIRLAAGCSSPKTPAWAQIWPGGWKRLAARSASFKPGDEVYGEIGAWGNGAFAEYVSCSRKGICAETGQPVVRASRRGAHGGH